MRWLTQRPVGQLVDQFHVVGDGQDVEVVEEDVHHQNDSQVQQGLSGDVPHLPFLASQLCVVCLLDEKVTGQLRRFLSMSKTHETPNSPRGGLTPSQPPHLGVKPVESHDGPEEEVGEVEVVFQQVSEGVAAFLAVTVLQCKAHAAHDAETTAAVEQDVLQGERTRDQRFLQEGVCTLHATHLSLKNHFFYFLSPSHCSTHLPGVIRLQLDGGQRGETRCEAHPLTLEPADAVEDEAVRQNQSHEGPAHGDQNCQTAVQPEDQGPALWVQRSRVTVDATTRSLTCTSRMDTDGVEGLKLMVCE